MLQTGLRSASLERPLAGHQVQSKKAMQEEQEEAWQANVYKPLEMPD